MFEAAATEAQRSTEQSADNARSKAPENGTQTANLDRMFQQFMQVQLEMMMLQLTMSMVSNMFTGLDS